MSSFSRTPSSDRGARRSVPRRAPARLRAVRGPPQDPSRRRVGQPPARRSSSTSAASTSSASSWSKRWRRVVELEQALGVERPDRRHRAPPRTRRAPGRRRAARRRPAPRVSPSSALIASTRPSRRCDVARAASAASSATRFGLAEHVDLGAGYGSSVEPPLDPEALGADGGEQVAAVGRARRLDDAGDGADVEARVATADLVAALDEHDAEPAVAAQARLDQRAVSLLEDVQRQHGVREEHRAEREHRQRLGHHANRIECAAQFARARSAPRPRRPSRRPRRAARRASTSNSRAASANCPSRPSSPARSPRWLRVMPGDAQPQPRDPRRPRSGRAAAACAAGSRASARRWRAAPTGIRNCGPERRAVVRGGEQLGAAGEVEPGALVERVEPLARRRRPRGSGRACPRRAAAGRTRRPTSIMRTLSVIGMPSRRSSTSSR